VQQAEWHRYAGLSGWDRRADLPSTVAGGLANHRRAAVEKLHKRYRLGSGVGQHQRGWLRDRTRRHSSRPHTASYRGSLSVPTCLPYCSQLTALQLLRPRWFHTTLQRCGSRPDALDSRYHSVSYGRRYAVSCSAGSFVQSLDLRLKLSRPLVSSTQGKNNPCDIANLQLAISIWNRYWLAVGFFPAVPLGPQLAPPIRAASRPTPPAFSRNNGSASEDAPMHIAICCHASEPVFFHLPETGYAAYQHRQPIGPTTSTSTSTSTTTTTTTLSLFSPAKETHMYGWPYVRSHSQSPVPWRRMDGWTQRRCYPLRSSQPDSPSAGGVDRWPRSNA
jgi:hypothetical protein